MPFIHVLIEPRVLLLKKLLSLQILRGQSDLALQFLVGHVAYEYDFRFSLSGTDRWEMSRTVIIETVIFSL